MEEKDYTNFENRYYLKPQTYVDDSNAFIDNLRDVQKQDTDRINADTYNLGTQVPSNLGGLSGSEKSFADQYQKPQTDKMIADLKKAAQEAALNQALSNVKAQWQKRYKDAYNSAARSSAARSGWGGGENTTPEEEGSNLEFITNNGDNGTMVVNDEMPTGYGNVTPYDTDENGATSMMWEDALGQRVLDYPSGFEATKIGDGAQMNMWPGPNPVKRLPTTSNSMGTTYVDPNGNEYIYLKADNMSEPSVFKIRK